MPVNIAKWKPDATTLRNILFYGRVFNLYPNGTSTTLLANGTDSGLGLLRGFTGLTPPDESANIVPIVADGVVYGSHVSQPTTPPNWSFTQIFQDLDFEAVLGPRKLQTIEDWDIMSGHTPCLTFNDTVWVMNLPALSTESASQGESGWQVFMFGLCKTLVPVGPFGDSRSIQVMPNARTTRPWGEALSTATHGVQQEFDFRFFSPYPVTLHTFIGDGTATSFTVDYTPVAENGDAVVVWNQGTKLTYSASPSTAAQYSVTASTKTITFGAAPTAGHIIVVAYQIDPSSLC